MRRRIAVQVLWWWYAVEF